jgi:hypothetical protein
MQLIENKNVPEDSGLQAHPPFFNNLRTICVRLTVTSHLFDLHFKLWVQFSRISSCDIVRPIFYSSSAVHACSFPPNLQIVAICLVEPANPLESRHVYK